MSQPQHDLAGGKELHRLRLGSTLSALVSSPDGKILASGEYNGTLKLWQADTGQELATLRKHTEVIWAVRFSPDGKVLASGSDDGALCLWDVPARKLLHAPESLQAGVWTFAFTPDGKMLASGGRP